MGGGSEPACASQSQAQPISACGLGVCLNDHVYLPLNSIYLLK
jgi:hypothetical protein